MNKTLYLKLNQISEIHEKRVYLKDIAEIYSDDPALMAKCRALKIRTVPDDHNGRYVDSVITVLEKIYELDPQIQVNNLGETDFIIEYESPDYAKDRFNTLKVAVLCILIFFGSAFSIMVFNNDVGVDEVFAQTYQLFTGRESDGYTVMELGYSIGIAVGIIVFYNHLGGKRITKDPTPMEVQMRQYEDDVNTTLVEGCNRKETNIDVD